MNSHSIYLFFSTVLLGLIGSVESEYCTERYYSNQHGYTTRTVHCSFGCCGSYYDQYCCVSSTGFIVGIVFAVIVVIAVVATTVCCCIKNKGARGRVVHPNRLGTTNPAQNNVFIVPSAGHMPPAYSSTVYTSDPAMVYPPPPAYYPTQPSGFATAMPPAYGMANYGTQPPAYSATAPAKYPQSHTPPTNPFNAAAGAAAGTATPSGVNNTT